MATASFTALTAFSTPRQISEVVNNILRGKMNCTGEVTLTNSATSTIVTDFNAGPESCIVFMPQSSDAASELYGGSMFVSARARDSFTITHTSGTNTRKFTYAIIA